jgi:sulfate permease, SulP family
VTSHARTKSTLASRWRLYVPKLIVVLRQGYTRTDFGHDLIAGLTVAIVALPLAMALAIASGTTPDKGLVTAIIAGFLISCLSGSRFQIGGPTGAFVVVVFNVIAQHGYDGLVIATLMAGIILLLAGLAGFGTIIKYMPQPVITGFTSGIAVIIASSQVKDFFGLQMPKVPAGFIPQWTAYLQYWQNFSSSTLIVAVGSLALIIGLRRFAPKLPAFLFAVIGGAIVVWVFNLPVDTIGSRFGGIPNTLPAPAWPSVTYDRMKELLPSAFTIAFLAGIESLLSAVVADGITGRRHRSNCELVGQGVANIASSLFGGLPATGAVARTVTNIRSGGKSPISGMAHALFLLAFMYLLAPLASYVPLASLAAVLIMVAWNMSEIERFTHLMKAPKGDRLVLLLTFGLTALVDLTVAIEVGVVLAAMIFMHRMASAVEIQTSHHDFSEDIDDLARTKSHDDKYDLRKNLPPGVEVFQFRGPFFFGAVSQLQDVMERTEGVPRAYILDFRDVPLIDASGASALGEFVNRCRRHGTAVVFSGLKGQPHTIAARMGLLGGKTHAHMAENFAAALKAVKEMTA